LSTAQQIGSLREVLLDQAIRKCCVDRLSWQPLPETDPVSFATAAYEQADSERWWRSGTCSPSRCPRYRGRAHLTSLRARRRSPAV